MPFYQRKMEKISIQGKEVEVYEITTKVARKIIKKLPDISKNFDWKVLKNIREGENFLLAITIGGPILDLLVEFAQDLTNLNPDDVDSLPTIETMKLLEAIFNLNQDFFEIQGLSASQNQMSKIQEQEQTSLPNQSQTPISSS